jgi:hypothetical protein
MEINDSGAVDDSHNGVDGSAGDGLGDPPMTDRNANDDHEQVSLGDVQKGTVMNQELMR